MDAKELTEYVARRLQASCNIVWSWGVQQFAPIVPVDPRHPDCAGLQFYVNGFNFCGHVQIVYNEGRDVFEVSFWKDGKKVDENTDVYVDELVAYIDGRVEMVDGYEQKVKETYPEYFNPDGTPKMQPDNIIII